MAAEIGQRRAVDHGPRLRAELALEDRMGVRAGDGVHGVETHAKAGGDQRFDRVEVEQRLHQRQVLRHRIDDLDGRAFQRRAAQPVDVDVGRVGDFVGVDRLGAGEDRVGDLFGRGAAGADVVLDAEVAFRPARIVARRQDDPAEGADMADEGRGGGGREDAALADHDPAEAVGRRDLGDDLDRLPVVVAAVAAEDQGLAPKTLERIEDRLDEIFQIVRRLEDGHLLAQARRAGLLVGEGFGRDGLDHVRVSSGRADAAF